MFASILLLSGIALSAAPAGASTSGADSPRLPAPTGDSRVGTTSFELVDGSRLDPWFPATGSRRLEVSLWYPTRQHRGTPAPYISPALAEATLPWGYPAVPDPSVIRPASVRTNSLLGAVPDRARGGRPLVVMSPGFELSRTSLTVLAEDLASHGYVVAALDHPFEAPVERPDGTILPCGICGTRDPAIGARVVAGRSADISFAVGVLLKRYRGLLDPSKIAAVGHSIGGAAAVTAMLNDRRLTAAVNLDGSFFGPLPPTQARRPVLLFGDATDVVPAWDAGWATVVPQLPGPTYWTGLGGVGHYTYVDTTWMLDRFGVRDTVPADEGGPRYGTLPGTRTIEITRAYLLDFLAYALLHHRATLLTHPSRRFPEAQYRYAPTAP
jgi:dienelactone hydrolase